MSVCMLDMLSTQPPASAGWAVVGDDSESSAFLITLSDTLSWKSWAHSRTPTVYRTGTSDF